MARQTASQAVCFGAVSYTHLDVYKRQGQVVPQQVAPLVALSQKMRTSLACETTAHYMKRRFHNPALRTLLTTHWGDYGVEPERSAFVAHAMIVGHYMN